jgi:hypothetical protein
MKTTELLDQIEIVNPKDEAKNLSLLNESLVTITSDSSFYKANCAKLDSFILKVLKVYGHCDNGTYLNEMLLLFWHEKKEIHHELILKIISLIVDNNINLNWYAPSNTYLNYKSHTIETNHLFDRVLLTPYLLLFILTEACLVSSLERKYNLKKNKGKIETFLLKQKLTFATNKCAKQFESIYRYICLNAPNELSLVTNATYNNTDYVHYLTYFLMFECELNHKFLDYVFSFDPIQVAYLSTSHKFLKILSSKSQDSLFHEKLFKSFTHAQYRWLENKEPLEEVDIKHSTNYCPKYTGVASILSHAPETMIDFYLDYQKDLINVKKEDYSKYNWLSFILSNPLLSIEYKNKKINDFHNQYQDEIYTPNLFTMSFKGLIDSKFNLEEQSFLDDILKLPNIDKNLSYYHFGNAYFFAMLSNNKTDKLLEYLFHNKVAFLKNDEGYTALHELVKLPPNNLTETIFEILKTNKIDFDIEDNEGNTAMHIVFNYYFLNDLSFTYFSELLMSGAHINITNKKGKTIKDLFYEKLEEEKYAPSLNKYQPYYIKFESLIMSSFELQRLEEFVIKPIEITEKKITKL